MTFQNNHVDINLVVHFAAQGSNISNTLSLDCVFPVVFVVVCLWLCVCGCVLVVVFVVLCLWLCVCGCVCVVVFLWLCVCGCGVCCCVLWLCAVVEVRQGTLSVDGRG